MIVDQVLRQRVDTFNSTPLPDRLILPLGMPKRLIARPTLSGEGCWSDPLPL